LPERLALITGGASLIGEAVAQVLAADGWSIALTDIDLATAHQVAGKLPAGSVAAVERMDVTDIDEVERVVSAIVTEHVHIDGLVNVAGGGRGLGVQRRDFVDFSLAERDKVVEVNLKGVFNVVHAVLPKMIAAKRGAIVSIAAARGLRGGPKATIYSACKAAIIVFGQSLAQEVGRHGVRVNTVAPGNTAARWKSADETERTDSPLGRPTSPHDVGDAVAFLLSDRASHITGSCLDVSGGTALH
jgi:NAD(P)-dependent dehydrogenase (short-subunit alcohol dehydrogenase family)